MLESIQYVVSFNTTGRTLKNHLKFKPGITVIKGENESGKSFVLEMIRYALFGSDALRGLRSDYSKLDVTLKITVKGKHYTIVRKGNKATVNINEAVGTSATNKFIVELLGFGLPVFDIAANANQGELDKLTKDMGPTERRKIIDDVTGLSQFEQAEKDCREQANQFRKVAEALEAQLVEPVEPARPDDYEPSETLKAKLDLEIRHQAMRDSFEHMEEPQKPQKPWGSPDAIDHERERETWLRQKNSILQQLNRLPEIDNAYARPLLEKFLARLAQDSRGPRPSGYGIELLEQWRDTWLILEREAEPLRCQECGAIISGRELPEQPKLSKEEIDRELKAEAMWKDHEYDESLPESPLTRQEIEARLAALDAQPERELLEKQLHDMGNEPADRSEEADLWIAYEESLRNYERLSERYSIFLTKKAEIDSLPEPEPFLREKYEMALRYETLLSKYEATKDIYETQQQKLLAVKEKREGFKRGSDALKDARKDVKRYLVPSLSKVASQLLVEMTDGERRVIKIDENFDIWVDNQPVRTLSGSGVSVANLALRIALGQVLTQSVIPIFLADEIDANMAEKRTKATHASLTKLRSKLKQIIVVTHKEFEGDNTICLT